MRLQDDGEPPKPVAMSATEGLRRYGLCLSTYEKNEITSFPKVYYCGQGCSNKIDAPTKGPNEGYDNAEGEYIFRANDHIAYRYELLEELGSGAFGQVFKATDHTDGEVVALKLVRNQRKVLQQAVQEIRILEHINERDPNNRYGIVRMIESFSFRGHTCMSYELLGTNLYEYLKEKDFYPMALHIVRGIAARMLVALTFLDRENIMHCDLKPENILIRDTDPSVVKLVDLGSASFDAHNPYMYIQSRFYRAPEVIMEQKYTKAIDWWSFGCILCELANGDPVFPGDDEKDQLGCIMEYLGPPPPSFIEASSARRRREFFDEALQPKERQSRKGHVRAPNTKSLAKFLGVSEDDDFLSFVRQFLQWDPAARVTPRNAMQHKWIREEFVFATAAKEKSPSESPTNADVSSSGVTPEAEVSEKLTSPLKSVPGEAAAHLPQPPLPPPPAAADVTDVAPSTWATARPAMEPAAAKPYPDLPSSSVSYHGVGAASVPPTAPASDEPTRATAQSTGGGPRRPAASQRRGSQDVRARRHRSTAMTDVEMPSKSTGSLSGVMTEGGDKSRDFITAVGTDSSPAGSPNRSAKQESRGRAERGFAPPALKPSSLSSSMLSAAVQPARRRGSGDVAEGSAARGPISANAPATSNPMSASRGVGAVELRRRLEAGAVPAQRADLEDSLDEGVERRGAGGLRVAAAARHSTSDKQPNGKGASTAAKLTPLTQSEPAPSTPTKPARGRMAAPRRREYSLTLYRTPTPPPLEPPVPPPTLAAAARPHTHVREVLTTAGHGAGGRPRESASALRTGKGQAVAAAAAAAATASGDGEVRSSGDTGVVSPPNPSSRVSTAAGTPAPRGVVEAIVLHRSTLFNMPVMPDNGSPDPDEHRRGGPRSGASNGATTVVRNPVNGDRELAAPQRHSANQRQRQNIVAVLNEAKGPSSSSSTVLPPLGRSTAK